MLQMMQSWVYVVKCDCGDRFGYYVGVWTGETCGSRKHQHFQGLGSKFTRKYNPISFLTVGRFPSNIASRLENRLTEYYMKKVGFRYCRGGNHLNMKKNCHQLTQLMWWAPSSLRPLILTGDLGEVDPPLLA
jgi:predicted GIY-YIG superfamily endonuclease